MSLQVRTTPEADAQIDAIDNWWRRNRLSAPDLFLDGLAASLDQRQRLQQRFLPDGAKPSVIRPS